MRGDLIARARRWIPLTRRQIHRPFHPWFRAISISGSVRWTTWVKPRIFPRRWRTA